VNRALTDRVRGLSDQETVYYLNLIAAAAVDRPEPGEICERLDQPRTILVAESDDVEGAQSAREALLLLSAVEGGAPVVEAALAQPAPKQADFGLVTGPALLIVAYIAVTARVKIKIGDIEIEKEGIAGDKQVELAKGFLSAFAKAVLGG
jgi:hypothetical protein